MKKGHNYLIPMLIGWTFLLSVFNNGGLLLYAQQPNISVKGVVKDVAGEPLIGVNVLVQGASIGVITDINGVFHLQGLAPKSTLKITYVGYASQTVTLGRERNLSIILQEDSEMLEEVTVVAYGSQKKATLTGAISQIGTKDLLKSPSGSITNALAGAITGVSSVQMSGQPGSDDAKIYIRGVGSLTEGASSPLTLVDGVERPFSQLDPNEIENITVLKDASATAVFGVRGANGVILVTTRRGVEGKTKISISSSFGVQVPIKLTDCADGYTWVTAGNELFANDGKSKPAFEPWVVDALKHNKYPEVLPSTDWNERCFRDQSFQTQHNITITGGTKSVRFFTSLGYLFQDGILKQLPTNNDYNSNFNYNRFNYRTNIDIDVTKTTTMKMNIGGRLEQRNQPNAKGDGSLWKMINWSAPIAGGDIIDGVATETNREYYGGITFKSALDAYYDRGYNRSSRNVLNIDYILHQKLDFITKGLSVEAKASYNGNFDYKKKRMKQPTWVTPKFKASVEPSAPNDSTAVYVGSGSPAELTFGEGESKSRDWYVEGSVRYQRDFGQHKVSGLLLYNQSKTYYPSTMSSIPSGYVGVVGRLTYDYASKYLFEANAGYNGSENFAPGDTRYGLFPAFSAGWVISEEKFMKEQKVIDFLKIRASAGFVGNDLLRVGGTEQRFLYMEDKYSVNLTGFNNGYNFGVDIPEKIPSAKEGLMGNPLVTWETSFKQNYGLDMTLLGQRLSVSADLFFEKRSNILAFRTTTPAFVAAQLPAINLGKVENRGWEASVKWDDTVNGFRYWINANTSFARNKIIYMDETPPNEPYLWRTGRPVGTAFGREFYAFYEDGLTYPDGTPLADHTITLQPGDAVYYDLNKDGVINNDDETAIGFANRPEYIFGLQYGINYKGFDLSMQWSGATHVSRVLSDVYRIPFGGADKWEGLFQFMWDERWTPETARTAKAPRFAWTAQSNNYGTSSLWVRDASYIRLKTVELGYTFHFATLKKLGMQSLRLYANGYNLLTFDKLKVLDPEEPSGEGGYPLSKIFNLGVNIQF